MAVLWDKNTKPYLGWKDGSDVYATERGWVKSYPWGEVLEVAIPGLSADAAPAGSPVGTGKAEITSIKYEEKTYNIGDEINITVVFDEKVDVTGTPTLAAVAGVSGGFAYDGQPRQKNQVKFKGTSTSAVTDLTLAGPISGTITDKESGQASDLAIPAGKEVLTGLIIA
jgi:hypothetical protein